MYSHPRPCKQLIYPLLWGLITLCGIWIEVNFFALNRVKGDSPCWGDHWCAMEHAFAFICTYLHICSIQYTCKESKLLSMANIYLWPYVYVCKAQCMHICPAYMHIWRFILLCTPTELYIYIYIYIYMQCETPKHCMCKPLALQEAADSIA